MAKYYSPLRYPGGKNCIFPFMSNLFYENQLIGIRYAEPYAGGAGLALRLLFEGYVDAIYINDLDQAIYTFWKMVLERPDDFCEWIQDVDVSIANWKKCKEIHKRAQTVSSFELAKATFFLNRTNISGILKGGVIGGIEQKGKYKINARFNKSNLIDRIQRIKSVSNRIFVSNYDGIRFIEKLDKRKEKIFIYLDPPYYQKGADLYMNFYSQKDHRKLSEKVKQLRNKWIISYDNNEFILNLYAEKQKITHRLSQSASNRTDDELFIFSDKISYEDSVKALKHPVFI
jgi:DNA adenine methylase